MKSLFDKAVSDGIVNRISSLQPHAERQWGKMHPAQMMAHCSAALTMANGQSSPRRIFLGRILGPLFKPSYVGEKDFPKNSPTGPELVVSDERDFVFEKERLLQLVRAFAAGGEEKCTRHPHPFFGKLTPGEWGIGMYKHLDHHLRQFGA